MPSALPAYLSTHPQGCVLTVQVTPNGKQSAVIGPHENTLKIRLAAKPVEGAANTELIRHLSKLLNIPKSQITLLTGETSRQKRLLLQNLTPAQTHSLLSLTLSQT